MCVEICAYKNARLVPGVSVAMLLQKGVTTMLLHYGTAATSLSTDPLPLVLE